MRPRIPLGVTPLVAFLALLKAQAHVPGAHITPGSIARSIAAAYGEKHPDVVSVNATTTDSTPHERMYVIELAGRFRHRGKPMARFLTFSALADRNYIWGITARDRLHHLVWIDPVPPYPLH
ncbi:MAG: hypothetical protein PVSMB7_07690 [Chloroflexota bacterium]